ncbi:hypothetical protein PMAYCL1PPCAC_21626 [Pristionchus mayeri]|uniref:Protein kinase n=1 Tax=Pristionchus mayeri TaxID=1317129 RepID=A0AAN5CVI2_9BILA|nr:hypothetical protein PMAYCL1PPCAC_21626 [Pristionchus mayeri]
MGAFSRNVTPFTRESPRVQRARRAAAERERQQALERSHANILQFPNTTIARMLHDCEMMEHLSRGKIHSGVIRARKNNTDVAVKWRVTPKVDQTRAAELNELFSDAVLVDHANITKIFGYAIHEMVVHGCTHIAYAFVMDYMTVSLQEISKVAPDIPLPNTFSKPESSLAQQYSQFFDCDLEFLISDNGSRENCFSSFSV